MEKFHPIFTTCPLFEGIRTEDLMTMMDCIGGYTASVSKGQPVLREGGPATHLGMVLSGAVRMERTDIYGNRSILGHMNPGELFAETYACAGISALPVSIIADADCQVLFMDCRRITTSCASACAFHSRIMQNLLRLVATKNLVYDQKIQIVAHRSTREKLMAYLLSEAKRQGSKTFTIPYDRQALADYLEVDRSGLSAEIGKLRKEGVLESVKNRFTLCVPATDRKPHGLPQQQR